MSDVRPQDVLLRVGGGTLKRLQTLASAGAGRGYELPYTFGRATVKRALRDRDGTARRASAGNLAIDWPTGLVDASGNAIGGPLSEGARTQLVTDPENFGAWTVDNLVARTSGQADPFGGTGAYLFDSNTPFIFDQVRQDVPFTGNATKAFALFIRAGTAAQSEIVVLNSVPTDRHRVAITWTAGVPSLATVAGSGALYTPILWTTTGWYRIAISANGIIAAETNRFQIRPDSAGGGGTVFVFGANAWNAPFPSSYQAPGESAGVADALTSPFNWGPSADITVLIRLGRPLHADAGASTALGVSPGIFSFGAGAAARIGAYFDPAARNIISVIDTATTDATQTTPIPAGQPTICIQYKNLTTGGQTALDVGSGMTAFSSVATAFSAFSSQTMRVGRYDDELYGVVGDLVIARGLFSRAEMMAIS